jgi:DNA-binding transcriptional LysR family regulator
MPLNLYLLHLFAAVAQHSKFSPGCRKLHVSQPAVSKGECDFEAEIRGRALGTGPGRAPCP